MEIQVNGEILSVAKQWTWTGNAASYLITKTAGTRYRLSRIAIGSEPTPTMTLTYIDEWYELADALQGARFDDARQEKIARDWTLAETSAE